jgi:hypothetical protein
VFGLPATAVGVSRVIGAAAPLKRTSISGAASRIELALMPAPLRSVKTTSM